MPAPDEPAADAAPDSAGPDHAGRDDAALDDAALDDAALDDARGGDAVLPVTVGTIAWVVAFVVLLGFRTDLQAHGTTWWLWVCVTGFCFGLIGLWWVRRRREAYRRADG